MSASHFIGLDIGCHHSVIASSDASAPSLVSIDTNALSNRSTPSMVGFDGRVRVVGESAEARMNAIPKSIVTHIPLLLGSDKAVVDMLKNDFHVRYDVDPDTGALECSFDGKDVTVSKNVIIATLLRTLANFASSPRSSSVSNASVCVSVAPLGLSKSSTSSEERIVKDVLAASHIAQLATEEGCSVHVLSQANAFTNCWVVRNLPGILRDLQKTGPLPKRVMFTLADCGFAHFTCQSVVVELQRMTAEEARALPSEERKTLLAMNLPSDGEGPLRPVLTVLGNACEVQLGTYRMVDALMSLVPQASQVGATSKQGFRIRQAAQKALKELSGGTEAKLELECFPSEDEDFKTMLKRDVFEIACRDLRSKLSEALQTCVTQALTQLKELTAVDDASTVILGVEIVGGGARVPFVQADVQTAFEDAWKAVQGEAPVPSPVLRRTLDGSSAAALGAALYAAGHRWVPSMTEAHPVENVAALVPEADLEQAQWMSQVEAAEEERGFARNALEGEILSLQSASCSGKYAKLIPDAARDAIQKADEWFLDAPLDTMTVEDYRAKQRELQEQIATLAPEFVAAKEEERRASEEAIAKAAAEAAAARQGQTKEDHDTRVLPNSQRIQRATLQKDEGNELLKGGARLELVIERYNKGLQHLTKLHTPTAEEQRQADELAVVLHQNSAMVHIKAGDESSLQLAKKSCSAALAINGSAVKALFRRATACEKLKELEEAAKDLRRALEVAPEDVDCQKFLAKVDAAIKARDEKQKKVFKKMFA